MPNYGVGYPVERRKKKRTDGTQILFNIAALAVVGVLFMYYLTSCHSETPEPIQGSAMKRPTEIPAKRLPLPPIQNPDPTETVPGDDSGPEVGP